jgi:hypothetical protein
VSPNQEKNLAKGMFPVFGVNIKRGSGKRSTLKSAMGCVEVLLKVMDEKQLDPFLVFTTVVDVEPMAHDTCIGSQLDELLVLAASEASVTVSEMIDAFRDLFYGTKKEGRMGVSRVRSTDAVTWKHAKKKEVLLLYLHSTAMGSPQMPMLLQIIYTGKDKYSGARVHQVFKNAQDGIVACQQMFLSEAPPLAIMEVPNKIQGTGKFYIDWDMKLDKLLFLEGTPSERVEQARELALQTPPKVCAIFIELGYVSNDADVQIVIKEGSRASVGGDEITKISFHFVFSLFGTSAQMTVMWNGLFSYLDQHGGCLSSVLREPSAAINDISGMNGYGGLVGVDMHPYSNPEQGLAMGFSKKHLLDPYTRFIEILHVVGGVATRAEIPCNRIWMGRCLARNNKPPDIWYTLP